MNLATARAALAPRADSQLESARARAYWALHDDELAALQRERRNLGERERRAAASGRRALPCPSCHRFKGRPSDVCDFCGDDPVTFNGSRVDFDRAVWGC